MRILLDECVPRQIRPILSGHDVSTVQQQNWRGVRNGLLLKLAQDADFEVLMTCDKNIPYQQTLTGRSIAVVELRTNRLSVLLTLANEIQAALATVTPGSYTKV